MRANILLAIESSCDDSSASIIINGEVKSNVTATQEVHKEYGGVVPEVASRSHEVNIIPVVAKAISIAGIAKNDIQAVGVTRGPGLLGSLIVGLSFAKGFALANDIPLIEVNHMQAHILAHFAEKPFPEFPFLCLTVSGGHTQIVLVKDYHEMEVIGQTLDDAAGEAFDKSGKMMGLDYPAGPIIDKLAKEGKAIYEFGIPKIENLDFSFSGLKTSIRYFLRDRIKENPDFIEQEKENICCSIQTSIVNILMAKLKRAAKETGISEIAIAGGVSANSFLRTELERCGLKHGWTTYIPKFEYCTDNAAMIGISAYYKFLVKDFANQEITPAARLKF